MNSRRAVPWRAIRDEARAILEEKPGDRETVLKRFDRALDLAGDVARGEQVFKRVCEKCHRMNGAGADVGPDLGTVRNRPASLLRPTSFFRAGRSRPVTKRISGGVETGVLRREERKETIARRRLQAPFRLPSD